MPGRWTGGTFRILEKRGTVAPIWVAIINKELWEANRQRKQMIWEISRRNYMLKCHRTEWAEWFGFCPDIYICIYESQPSQFHSSVSNQLLSYIHQKAGFAYEAVIAVSTTHIAKAETFKSHGLGAFFWPEYVVNSSFKSFMRWKSWNALIKMPVQEVEKVTYVWNTTWI